MTTSPPEKHHATLATCVRSVHGLCGCGARVVQPIYQHLLGGSVRVRCAASHATHAPVARFGLG